MTTKEDGLFQNDNLGTLFQKSTQHKRQGLKDKNREKNYKSKTSK